MRIIVLFQRRINFVAETRYLKKKYPFSIFLVPSFQGVSMSDWGGILFQMLKSAGDFLRFVGILNFKGDKVISVTRDFVFIHIHCVLFIF